MSKIHYFQRYDQKENWITNSTLLLLSRLNYHSRSKFENVINGILSESNIALKIGASFVQQEKGKNSVADGAISQSSFKILIETKLYDNFTLDQLKRHLGGFEEKQGGQILLALSKGVVSTEMREEINKYIKTNEKDIKFANTTFENLIGIVREALSDYDTEMQEILDDYTGLCHEQGLLNYESQVMLAFTAGQSFPENIKYNLYYDPGTRNHNIPFSYVGLYKDKRVKAIGKLVKTVYCDYEDGKLIPTMNRKLELTKDEYNRIKEVIETTEYYDLRQGTKFLLVDNFHETEFVKTSPSSIRAKKYFFLKDFEGFKEGISAAELAEFLKNKVWE